MFNVIPKTLFQSIYVTLRPENIVIKMDDVEKHPTRRYCAPQKLPCVGCKVVFEFAIEQWGDYLYTKDIGSGR